MFSELTQKIIIGVLLAVIVVLLAYPYLRKMMKKKPEPVKLTVAEEKPSTQVPPSELPGQEEKTEQELQPQQTVEGFTYEIAQGTKVPSGMIDMDSTYYMLDDGNNRQNIVTDNKYSKSCCTPQYPTPFALDNEFSAGESQFVGTQLMGNNPFSDVGCLCLTKDQATFLSNRGGNATTV